MDTPKSYLTAEEREALLREGGMNLVYLAESQEAGRAGDEDTAWEWLKLANLPATALSIIKRNVGSQFVRDMGLNTAPAEAAYGPGWLDRA